MKTLFLVALAALFTTLGGCASRTSANPKDYVGEYIFTSGMEVPPAFADFLILKRDFSAIQVTYSASSGQISTRTTTWRLDRGTSEHVVIGGQGAYPIESTWTATRLGINDDLGQFYEKVR